MAARSGKYAEALFDSCNFLEFESWTLTYGSNPQEYNSRAGAGSTQTVDGVNSGSGEVTGFLDTSDPITGQVTTGSLVTLICRSDTTGPVQATGSARIGQFTLGANRDGTPQRVTIPFVTHGAWTFPT